MIGSELTTSTKCVNKKNMNLKSKSMNKKVISFYALVLFMELSCTAQDPPIPPITSTEKPKIFYQWNYDGPDPLHNLAIEDESALKNGVSVVADPLNPTNKVLKIALLQGNDRTEVSLFSNDLKNILYYYADAAIGFKDKANKVADGNSLGSEMWMSIKILKPQEQNTNGIKPCIVQLGPVSNMSLNPPVGSSGFCQLRVRNSSTLTGDSWNWRVFGRDPYTPVALNIDNSFIGPTYGKWEKFIFHCKYSSGADGLLEVWKDGVKYISLSGANAIAMNRFRIKWGIYLGIGSSAGQDLNCYFDDVKVAGSNSSYSEISQ